VLGGDSQREEGQQADQRQAGAQDEGAGHQ
jgi:hypothetical protein